MNQLFIVTDNDEKVKSFVAKINENGNQQLININAETKVLNNGLLITLNFIYMIPNIYLLAIPFFLIALVWFSWIWIFLCGFFVFTFLPFSKTFQYYAFKKGLRKTGYTGYIAREKNGTNSRL